MKSLNMNKTSQRHLFFFLFIYKSTFYILGIYIYRLVSFFLVQVYFKLESRFPLIALHIKTECVGLFFLFEPGMLTHFSYNTPFLYLWL